MVNVICKNCKQHFKGHYCNNCGQPAETRKLDFHFLIHDIQHGLIYWTNMQFFNKLTKTKAFLLSVWSHLIFLICSFILLIIIVLTLENFKN